MCVLLAGCAGTEPRSTGSSVPSGEEPAPVRLEASTRVPLIAQAGRSDGDGLVETDLRAGLGDDLVEVRSRYSVASGALVQSLGQGYEQGQSLPTQLARQSIEHSFRLSVPGWLGAPVQIGFDQNEASVYTLQGQQRQENSRAHLAWNPAPVRFEVEWTPPRETAVAGNPFDCLMEGRVRLPTEVVSAGMSSALDVSQSDCLVRAPDRGVNELPMQSRGVSWRWGEGLNNTIHMNRVELIGTGYGVSEMMAGYELGMRQRHSFHGWQVEADVALRQSDSGPYGHPSDEESRWAVDVMLRRQLQTFALTARWMQAKDPLWFVPEASPIGRERLSLLLDFSSWLTRLMPGVDAGMSTSWEHSEDAAGQDDNQFRWDFSLSW
jgi:hypothetical protein